MAASTVSQGVNLIDTILLSIEEGVTIYDTEFRLVAWNDRYSEMGITPQEHVKRGLHIEDTYRMAAQLGVFGEGDPEQIANERIRDVYSGVSPDAEDLIGTHGAIIEIRRYFLPGIGVAAVFSDVTEKRRTAAMVRRVEDLEVLARVTGGVSHDFNNVLQAVETNLALAKMTGDLKHVDAARQATQSGADLARSMLQLVRPMAPKNASNQQDFEVTRAIRTTIHWIERVLRDNISLELDIRIEPTAIGAEEGRFSLAMVNLIMNSQDAMPRGGKIRVLVDRPVDDPNRLLITIHDNGYGMSKELIQKANEPFFTTKGERGTGLGLCEVRSFVEGAGGSLDLNSVQGSGSTAVLSLPTRTAVDVRDDPACRSEGWSDLSYRVLLVEDNLDVQNSTQHFLNTIGCRTIAVTTGEEAIDLLRIVDHGFFDIVVSDIELGGASDGRDVANFARRQFPELGIMLCTANASEHLAGIPPDVRVFHKPLEVDQFRGCLSRYG